MVFRDPPVDIAHVVQGQHVLGIDAQGALQGRACHLELSRLCIQHGQIVVGLGNLGKFLGNGQQLVAGFFGFSLCDQHARSDQAHLRVARIACQIGVGRLQGRRVIFGGEELVDLFVGLPHQRGLCLRQAAAKQQ